VFCGYKFSQLPHELQKICAKMHTFIQLNIVCLLSHVLCGIVLSISDCWNLDALVYGVQTMTVLFALYYDDRLVVHLDNTRPVKFDIHTCYEENAVMILNTLQFIYYDTEMNVDNVLQRIAECAATLELQCVGCSRWHCLVETYKDWQKRNGALAIMNGQTNKVLYYLRANYSSWAQAIGEEEYEYHEDMDILCKRCAQRIKYVQRWYASGKPFPSRQRRF